MITSASAMPPSLSNAGRRSPPACQPGSLSAAGKLENIASIIIGYDIEYDIEYADSGSTNSDIGLGYYDDIVPDIRV